MLCLPGCPVDVSGSLGDNICCVRVCMPPGPAAGGAPAASEVPDCCDAAGMLVAVVCGLIGGASERIPSPFKVGPNCTVCIGGLTRVTVGAEAMAVCGLGRGVWMTVVDKGTTVVALDPLGSTCPVLLTEVT